MERKYILKKKKTLACTREEKTAENPILEMARSLTYLPKDGIGGTFLCTYSIRMKMMLHIFPVLETHFLCVYQRHKTYLQ
jgi:hypothetical protein